MKKLLLLLLTATAFAQFPTDGRGVILTGLPAAQDNLLGPLIPYGNSPWIFGDIAEKAIVDNMGAAGVAHAPALGTALSGTVSFTTGNNFLTTTADLRTPLTGQVWVTIAWDSIDGTATGRYQCPISSVTATQINCTEYGQEPSFSGATAYLINAPSNGVDSTYWTTENPSYTWNYYDVAIGLYRLYYRTGNTTYQTYARDFADYTWQWTLDHGYRRVYPRAASMISQFFRALDGHPERFPYLYDWINMVLPSWGNSYLTANAPAVDNREAGYMLWDIALGAKTDTDPTRHTQYCSWLTTEVPTWNSMQAADGSWPEDAWGNTGIYVSAPKTFTAPFLYQGAPWREAINVKAMEAAYESLNDTSSQGCNDPTLAAATLTAIENAVAWQNNYGRDTRNRGAFYEVNSQSYDQSYVYHPGGTVSTTLASTALVGSGTGWQTAGYCDGTHFIGIEGSHVYKIASCTDDTHATLSVAFGLYSEASNLSGANYSIAPAASASCGAGSATYCGSGSGDRNLTRTICGGEAWLYAQTHNATYLAWADECISATLGGPTAGPTTATNIDTITLPCSGPACDGYVNDFATAAPNCTDTGGVAPCLYGGSLYGNLGKNFGEAFGAPGIDNELAWRLWTASHSKSSRSVHSSQSVD